MVFNRNRITRTFNNTPKSNNVSTTSHGPNRISNITTSKIDRPTNINSIISENKRTSSLSGASLSLGGSGNGQPYIPESITNKVTKIDNNIPDAPMSTMADSKQFDLFKPSTWFGPPTNQKYNPNSAEAVKLQSNIIASKYPESTTPTNLKETASGTDFNSGTDLQGRQDAHAANLGIITSQPRSYTKGMEARGVSSTISMGWNLESKQTGSTRSDSIPSNLQFQANTKVHSGMVDTWQKGFLTSASRDKTSASHWLNAQLGKIDSMQGTDKNKNMFKKDLQGRYDGLFGSSNSPFQSPQNLKHNNISDGKLRLADKKEAKRLQAVQASQYFDSSSIQNQPPPKKIKPNTSPIQSVSLIDDYNNLGSIY